MAQEMGRKIATKTFVDYVLFFFQYMLKPNRGIINHLLHLEQNLSKQLRLLTVFLLTHASEVTKLNQKSENEIQCFI